MCGSKAERVRARILRGFTLVELLVVMAILALLLSVAAPRFFASMKRAEEAALRTDLRVFREAIDRHKADTGRYPESLAALAQAKYVRAVPIDPITQSAATWTVVPHPDGVTPGVFDVRSGATAVSSDGSEYASW